MNPVSSSHPLSRTSIAALLGALFLPLIFSSCVSTRAGALGGVDPNHPEVRRRAANIAAEPPGDYWIGRRWWTEGTRFWGYLRRPGEPWSQSRLTVFNERVRLQPDRLPEDPAEGPRHGYDHNYEYRIFGQYTGQLVYDPNSNLELPEFLLTGYELLSPSPGFLFQPGERYNPKLLPPKFPPIPR